MVEILTHAGCFIGIILLGWALRRVGFFKESDFHVLSKIVIKITLTAAIVTNFSGREMQTSMLLLTLMGFGFGVLMMIVGSVMYLPQGRERQAFAMLNASGCNIGNFAMPFAQGFLGPVGVIAVSLFDCGNSMICLGGAYSIASIVKSGDGKFRIKPILNNLVHSIPLMTYIFMTILGLLHLSLPAPVVEFAGIVGNANAFMAMLMIGVGFHLNGDPSQIGDIIKILGVRYIIGIALALAAYFILPLPLEYRQALVIVFLAPVASANPPFTAQMGSEINRNFLGGIYMVGRIYHVGLTVSDLDRSIAFYRDILRLEFQGEIFMEGEETDKMFRKENCKARVAYLNGSKALEAPPVELIQFVDSKIHKEQSDLFTTSISEVCFYTDDIDSVYKTLIENHVECLSEPQYFDFRADGFGESRAFYFRDPDGIILEMMQPL